MYFVGFLTVNTFLVYIMIQYKILLAISFKRDSSIRWKFEIVVSHYFSCFVCLLVRYCTRRYIDT